MPWITGLPTDILKQRKEVLMPFMLQCYRRDLALVLRLKGSRTWEPSAVKHLLQVTEAASVGRAAA